MRRIALLLTGSLLVLGLTACGGSDGSATDSTTSSITSSATDAATSRAAAGTSTAAAPTDCPTDNTRAFAKTRFVGDVGLIAGSFHHWIWKPYRAGKLTKGADGRTVALIKAGATGLLIAKLTDNAVKNVKASPVLCNAIAAPLGVVAAQIHDLTDKLKHGDLSTVTSINATLATVTSLLASAGINVKETFKK